MDPGLARVGFPIDWDLSLSKHRLMRTFEGLESLSHSTKQRIRHRIWARARELSEFEHYDGRDLDAYAAIVGILAAIASALVLAWVWSVGQSMFSRLGAIGIAALVLAIAALVLTAAFFTVSEQGLGRFERYVTLVYLLIAALVVLLIRSLPIVAPHTPQWLSAGMRSGLIGALILVLTLAFVWFAAPLFDMLDRLRAGKNWSRSPEANIVECLIEALGYLERLGQLERQQDESILETVEVHRRRNERIEALRSAHVSPSVVSHIERKPDGSEHEVYQLLAHREDGTTETVLNEERTLLIHIEPELRAVRQSAMRCIESAAEFIEHGLSTKLRVGSARIDEWMRSELSSRARTVKGWGRQIVLSSQSERPQLLTQVATAIEHAAAQDWSAIPKSEASQDVGMWQRLWKFSRMAVVGIVPLGFALVAPPLGLHIPLPIRDSLLTFALPWLLLQFIELVTPGGGDHLSRSKGMRDVLPKSLFR